MAAKKSLIRERLTAVRHRAVCTTCPRRWGWRTDFQNAQDEALAHWEENPSHDVTVYTEQTKTTVRGIK